MSPGCGSGQIHESGDENPIVTCIKCERKSCYSCKVPWHEGKSCDEFLKDSSSTFNNNDNSNDQQERDSKKSNKKRKSEPDENSAESYQKQTKKEVHSIIY